ncbi:GNAT family N-acetyltransferase [Legionella oakridgensis]|uniref:Acetyltransferase n=2 Tax=Legionella oakridgensis TaxID=29423 RepID=W0BGT7_9GAMM|nr:GNAT family N-acetyltransferase [Legionella oakridgensis]AHE67921.1 acetyltransferase [Legionella oakridgensis ATCC 33761 = DSM 21215]ETO92554.1 acetyltransferase [Legionella oakridgensis RV-2-2007]KTD38742.1 putative N-acetyltransferase YjaB [Legionella oakridgensis]STY20926.1 Uncharacterized N-acetyltransferase YjaB [Legionella longbeachae]
MICDLSTTDFDELINVWEQSVRATHHFLKEHDLQEIKQQILSVYFDAVELKGFKGDNGKILGFSGVTEQKLEMLFVLPNAQGQGVGSSLCRHALEQQKVSLVDVNEQNLRAIKFYKKMGFKKVGRSSLDGEGRPYPVLHLLKE